MYKVRLYIFLKLATNGQSDKRFSALAPKSFKVCIKSDFDEIILILATYGQREKAFLLSSKFCPQWIVCPCLGYIHMVKHEKMYIKSDFKAIFLNCNKWAK